MKYTEEQIEQMEGLINELMKINGELNLENEERKVQKLNQLLFFIGQTTNRN